MRRLSVAQYQLHPYKDIYIFIIRWGGVIIKPYQLRLKTRLFHLKMVYFVVVNNVEEINSEISRKHENAQVI